MFAASIPVDATFDAFAEDAIYDPNGLAKTVRIIRSSPTEQNQFSTQMIARETIIFEVRTADAVLWKNDDVIVVAGERRVLKIEVGAEPEYLDDLRLVRMFDTQKE